MFELLRRTRRPVQIRTAPNGVRLKLEQAAGQRTFERQNLLSGVFERQRYFARISRVPPAFNIDLWIAKVAKLKPEVREIAELIDEEVHYIFSCKARAAKRKYFTRETILRILNESKRDLAEHLQTRKPINGNEISAATSRLVGFQKLLAEIIPEFEEMPRGRHIPLTDERLKLIDSAILLYESKLYALVFPEEKSTVKLD